MKKLVLMTAVLFSLNARADVFEDYQTIGQEILAMTQDAATPSEDVVTRMDDLIDLGYQIMDLYIVKYTQCTEQFAQLKSLDAQISSSSYQEIDELYHDGKGLIAADKKCYRGRSMVVHPYQVAALAKEGLLQSKADVVDHELNEVIERAAAIKQDLGL